MHKWKPCVPVWNDVPKSPHLTASHLSTGADNIKKYWSRYYQGSQGVVFVLDSASSDEDLEAARNELHSALQHPQLCTLPFLILANHQDKPAARTPNQVMTDSIPIRPCLSDYVLGIKHKALALFGLYVYKWTRKTWAIQKMWAIQKTWAIRRPTPKWDVSQTPPDPLSCNRTVNHFEWFRVFSSLTAKPSSMRRQSHYFRTRELSTELTWGKSTAASAAAETQLLSKDVWESWRLKIAGLNRDVSSRWMTQERGVGASQQGIRLLTLTGDITGQCGRNAYENFQAWQTCPLRRRQSFIAYKLCISFLLLIIRKLPGASCQR